MAEAPIIQLIEPEDGRRLLRDRTGAEVDLTAAEAACEKRELILTFNRPSDVRRQENLRREASAFSVYERYGIQAADPSEPVDLILHDGAYEVARAEPPIGEMAKALHEMLVERDLLGDSCLWVRSPSEST